MLTHEGNCNAAAIAAVASPFLAEPIAGALNVGLARSAWSVPRATILVEVARLWVIATERTGVSEMPGVPGRSGEQEVCMRKTDPQLEQRVTVLQYSGSA